MTEHEEEEEQEEEEYTEEELDEIFNDLSEEEQEEVMETTEVDDWDELDRDVKEELLANAGYIELSDDDEDEGEEDEEEEEEDAPEAPESNPLALQSELPLVDAPGDGRGTVTVAGIDLPGAYNVNESGAGFESQYLEETMTGPDGETDYFPDSDVPGADEEGEESGGEEPPITLEIDARCGSNTMSELVDLRDQEDTFSVSIGDSISYDDMELEDLQRELTGDNPYDYKAKIVVKEWREYETENILDYLAFQLEDLNIPMPMGTSSGSADDGVGGINPTEAWPQNGTEDNPTVLEGGNHTVGDDEFMEHVILDRNAGDGSITANGDNWEIRDVGVRGEGSGPAFNLATNGGAGRLDHVYAGDSASGPSVQADDNGGSIAIERLNAPDGLDATGPSMTTDGGSYETIAASGQTITISGGDTFSNTLVDFTTGGSFLVHFTGGGTMRNIGFQGTYRGSGFVVSVNGGGQVLIENVYLGDGADINGDSFVHGPGGFFYHKSASANVTIRNVNCQGMTNNGFYYSNTNSGGSVRFESCYCANNGVTSYRVSDPSDEILNCVAFNDNTNYGPHYTNGITESNGRPLWVWSPGGVTIRGCDFAAGTYAGAAYTNGGASINWAGDNRVSGGGNTSTPGGNPDLSPPQGVPMNAETAASGESGGAPSIPGGGAGGGGTPTTTISDIWIDGASTAIRAGRDSGDTNISNANVANAGTGVVAEYGTVNVSNSDIQASNPQASSNGGEIESDSTNWGGDADPSPPGGVPLSPEEAAGTVNTDNPGFGGDTTEL